MPAAVFLSSTGEDLSPDCRPYAIRAIRLGGGEEVAMESWDTEFVAALDVCRRKVVQDSTHYLGIIAFRRGWVPPDSVASVTELEFEWALEARHPMAIFVPDGSTLFGKELMRRAAESGQTRRDKEAQEAFRRRVAALGTQMGFEDAVDLTAKVTRRVLRWSNGGLLGIAHQGEADAAPTHPRPGRADLRFLGRRTQVRAFEDALDLPYTLCLIHGPSGSGHEFLADRLVEVAESVMPSGARELRVAVGPWTDRSGKGLQVQVGTALELDSDATAGGVEDGLIAALQHQGIILRVAGVQRLEGGLGAFLEGFWQPVADALGAGAPHRLVCLVTLETAETPAEVTALEAGDPPNAADPAVLERLGAFSEEELKSWLRRWLSIEQATVVANELVAETGGEPAPVIHKLLYDDTIWP